MDGWMDGLGVQVVVMSALSLIHICNYAHR
jgi:hypothetical protein